MTEPVQSSGLWSSSPWADEALADPPAINASAPWRSLLRFAVLLLIASSVALFLSAVARSNVPANTPAERIAAIAHQISMFAMLVSLIAILAAYRLPALAAALGGRRGTRDRVDQRAGS